MLFRAEKAGVRTGCGVRSQVIDVLKAQIKRRPATKKVSTAVRKQGKNISRQELTVGLDLGDCNSWYCVLDEAGRIQLEQRGRTTAKALQEVFGAGLRKAVPHCLPGWQASSDGRSPAQRAHTLRRCDEAALAKRRKDNARFRATPRG